MFDTTLKTQRNSFNISIHFGYLLATIYPRFAQGYSQKFIKAESAKGKK